LIEEPAQASPVIVEYDCFIGQRKESSYTRVALGEALEGC